MNIAEVPHWTTTEDVTHHTVGAAEICPSTDDKDPTMDGDDSSSASGQGSGSNTEDELSILLRTAIYARNTYSAITSRAAYDELLRRAYV